MTEPGAKALVILPFATAELAEQFAQLVTVQAPEVATPFVMHGTAYNYRSEETGEEGQIIEVFPASNFEVFQGTEGEQHHVLQRIVVKGSEDEERTG